jgi:RecA-family ATPase
MTFVTQRQNIKSMLAPGAKFNIYENYYEGTVYNSDTPDETDLFEPEVSEVAWQQKGRAYKLGTLELWRSSTWVPPPDWPHVTFATDQSQFGVELTLEELVRIIQQADADSEEQLPRLKLAKFRDVRGKNGSQNAIFVDAKLEAISGIACKYDSGLSLPEVQEAFQLAGLKSLLFTAPGHTAAAPKLRLLMPTSKPLPPKAHARLATRLNNLLGDDISILGLSELYTFGCVADNPEHDATFTKGDCIDQRHNLDDPTDPTEANRYDGGAGNGAASNAGSSGSSATAKSNSGGTVSTPPRKPEPVVAKLKPLILELAEKLWGDHCASDGKTVTFKGGTIVVDLAKQNWFDFAHGKGGTIRELTQEAKQQGQQQQDVTFPLIDIRAWHGKSSPPRDWVVVNRVPVEVVTGLYGDGGVGKTILLLQLAVCIVLGKDWLGAKVPVSGAVLIMCCEDNKDELWRRLEKIIAYYKTDFMTLWERGFRIGTYAGKDAMMAYFERGVMKTTMIWDATYKQAKAIPNLRFVGIDNAADVFAGNEIDRREVRQFITKLHGLAIEFCGGVMLTAHPSLTGMNTGTGTSGSTGWSNAFRSRMYFNKGKKKKEEEDDGPPDKNDEDYRELEVMKLNYGREGEIVPLRWFDGKFIPENEGVGFVTEEGEPEEPQDPSAIERAEEEDFLTRLDEFEQSGRVVSYKPRANNYAPTAFSDGSKRRYRMYQKAMGRGCSRSRGYAT